MNNVPKVPQLPKIGGLGKPGLPKPVIKPIGSIAPPGGIPKIQPLGAPAAPAAAAPMPIAAAAPAPAEVAPALSPASGAGPALSPASGAGPALSPASGAGPALSPASGAGPVFNPASGAGPALSPASGAGPVFSPASGAGPALSPASGADPALSPSLGGLNSAPLGQPVAAEAPVAAPMPAPAPQPLIPALASSATQLPGQSLSSLDDFDDADGGIATQAVPKPSAADIERAIAEMNAANAAAQASAPSFDDGPIFGGAATEDGEELQYENDDPDNAGERTMMIDAAPDDDLDDIGGEKTQISMGAMEFDPLCGKLIVESGKTSQREYILVREKTSIGRAPNNDISISDIAMSRKHVEIDKFPEGFRIKDLDTSNGTVLNGYRIRVGQLRNNDIIEIGGIRFRFEQSGGDPDVLWHGEPKIEYHPNQKGGARPPAPGQANNSPSLGMSSQPVSLAKPEPQQPQQMESMLQRQNGGLGAPGWAPATMTSPYMMSYGPNALRNAKTTPVWANTLMVVLSVLCVASIIFLGFSVFRNQNIESEYEVAQNQVANVQKIFVECANYYKESAFDQAQDTLNKIDEVDKDNTILPDRELVTFYTNLIGAEKDLYSKIRKIRDKPVGVPTIEEYEEDLKLLREVPDTSVNMKLVPTVLQRTADGYHRKLKKEIREQVTQNNISEARKLLAKMSNLPEVQTDNDVKTLGKLISDKEKARR